MGSSRLIFEKDKSEVEYAPLTILFEKQCPIYMSYGMSYDDFWHGDAGMVYFYRELHKINIKQKDEDNWLLGMYVYEAIIDCSPILHAFSKKGTKPLPYAEKPYLMDKLREKTQQEKDQEKENERLKAIVHFNNWFHATKKQFENKK